MTRKTRIRTALATAAASAFALTGVASAGTATKVTIKPESGGFYGYLYSSPECSEERKVILFKQRGKTQKPRTDKKIASDTASLNGDRYQWSTGNTGLRSGRYYARAVRTPFCAPDNSKTLRAQA